MKKVLLILAVIVVIVASGFYWANKYKIHKQEQARIEAQEERERFTTLNGNLVEDESLAKQRPLAVVIENSPDARPQSGLSDAEIVYETLAEGGITRFLAVFQSREPKEIGPVRSARPYFNILANQFSAGYFHSGGSKQALAELANGAHKQLFDANEFSFGNYFFRNKTRSAPHNLYSTASDLKDLLKDKSAAQWQPLAIWSFEPIATERLSTAVTDITLPFSSPLFTAKYKFDPTTNSYMRSVGGKAAIDKNNNLQISPKNILVQLTTITPVPGDELLTVNVDLKGQGPCYLFTGGVQKSCTWKYENGKTVYTDDAGQPLKLQPGQTWIEIFPRDKQSLITWTGTPVEPATDQGTSQ